MQAVVHVVKKVKVIHFLTNRYALYGFPNGPCNKVFVFYILAQNNGSNVPFFFIFKLLIVIFIVALLFMKQLATTATLFLPFRTRIV